MMDNPQQSSIPESKTSISEDPQLSAKSFYGKRNWKKWILIYLFIAAVVYGAVYFLFLSKQGFNPHSASYRAPTVSQPTPTIDPRANWETYTHSESGYSVKYPSDKFIRLICQAGGGGGELLLEQRAEGETKDVIEKPNCARDFYYDIEIKTVGNPANNPMPTPKSDTFYKVTQEQITIGNNNSVSATQYVSELIGAPDGPFAKWRLEIYTPHNDSIHVLTSEKKELEEAINQILSTFKFLDQEQTIDTSNWKIYKRNNIFEIKYPEDWNVLINENNDSVIDFSDGTDIPRGPNVGYIDVKVVLSAPGGYDELFKKEVGSIEKGSKNNITVVDKFQIDGYPAIKLDSETTPGAGTEYSYEVFTYIQNPKVAVSISALALKGSERTVNKEFKSKYLSIYNKMLSTFRFLK